MRVSILCAVYNEELYIKETIDSVVEQSFTNWELIVVDDYSEDNTFSIVRKMAEKDPRIQVYSNIQTKGKVSSYNQAFLKASGEAMCFLGGDDRLTRNSIELRVGGTGETAREYWKDLSISFGQIVTFSDNKKFDGIRIPRRKDRARVSGGSIMFSASLGKVAFPLPISLPNEDTWMKIAVDSFAIRSRMITRVVLEYRQHPGNSHDRSMSFLSAQRLIGQRYAAFQIFLNRFSSSVSDQVRVKLEARIELEQARLSGSALRVMRCSQSSARERLSMLFYVMPVAYSFKKRFAKIIVGF